MRGFVLAAIVILIAIVAIAFGLVHVSQTREAKLPEIAVRGGQAPKFDVDTAKVNVSMRKQAIDVPQVDVGTKKEAIDVPVVDVDKAR